jgi:hypothetical protein
VANFGFAVDRGQRRPGRMVDCTAHSAAGRQLFIGGINEDIDGQGGDINDLRRLVCRVHGHHLRFNRCLQSNQQT